MACHDVRRSHERDSDAAGKQRDGVSCRGTDKDGVVAIVARVFRVARVAECDAASERLRCSRFLDDAGIVSVVPSGQRRHEALECRLAELLGMEMAQCPGVALTNQKEVHRLSVVGDDRRQAPVEVERIGDAQVKSSLTDGIGRHADVGVHRAKQAAGVGGVDCVPPRPAAGEPEEAA